MTEDSTKGLSNVIRIDDERIQDHLKHVVRGSVEETLNALRDKPECAYVKWKVWTQGAADGRLSERHAVWVDENGFFRGRVDYWH